MTGARGNTTLRKRHALQLFKTEMCKFYLQGRCDNQGTRCSYAHGSDEMRRKPDLTHTSICKEMLMSGKCTDPTCRYAHTDEELRATHGFYKMKMCGFSKSGRCKHGDQCRFAHNPEELRRAKPAAQDAAEDLLGEARAQGDDATPGRAADWALTQGMQGMLTMPQPPPAPHPGMEARAPARERRREIQNWAAASLGEEEAPVVQQHAAQFSMPPPPQQAQAAAATGGAGRQRELMSGGRRQARKQPGGRGSGNDSAAMASTDVVDSGSWSSSGNSDSQTEYPGSEESRGTSTQEGVHARTPADGIGAAKTTLLMTNIPSYLTQGALLSMLEDLNPAMRGKYDFFYCPWDQKAHSNLGYTLMNFKDPADAAAFQARWSNKELCRGSRGQKVLRVMKAALQGLQANVEYFSRVEVAECTDVRFRPLVRTENGGLQPLILDTTRVEQELPDVDRISWGEHPPQMRQMQEHLEIQQVHPPRRHEMQRNQQQDRLIMPRQHAEPGGRGVMQAQQTQLIAWQGSPVASGPAATPILWPASYFDQQMNEQMHFPKSPSGRADGSGGADAAAGVGSDVGQSGYPQQSTLMPYMVLEPNMAMQPMMHPDAGAFGQPSVTNSMSVWGHGEEVYYD